MNRSIGLAALLSLSAFAAAQFADGQSGPPPAPRIVTGKLGDWVGAGQAIYKVASVTTGLKDYKQRYNQNGKKLHPGFVPDRLAVIEVEIKNITDHPILPPVFMAALTDSDGVRATDWIMDAKQQSFLEESTREGRRGSYGPAEIAAGQTAKLALIFSVSGKAKPTALEFAPENFRDMPFGRREGFQAGSGGATTDGGQVGPRPRTPRIPRELPVHIQIDLTTTMHLKA